MLSVRPPEHEVKKILTTGAAVMVLATVTLGLRPRQLHPDESCDAAKMDNAGRLLRFPSKAAGALTARLTVKVAGHTELDTVAVIVAV